MKLYCSPSLFNLLAQQFFGFRWRLLFWSFLCIGLFSLLQGKISSETPKELIWLALLILFTGLQFLVFGAFIFFFQQLPSKKEGLKYDDNAKFWLKLYRGIEWCEAVLFFVILPLPVITFIYALIIT
jgi:hypothetical protein